MMKLVMLYKGIQIFKEFGLYFVRENGLQFASLEEAKDYIDELM